VIEEKKKGMNKYMNDYQPNFILQKNTKGLRRSVLRVRNQLIERTLHKFPKLKKFQSDINNFSFDFLSPSCEINRWAISAILIGHRNNIHIDYRELSIEKMKKQGIKKFLTDMLHNHKFKTEFKDLIFKMSHDGFK